MPKSPVSVSLSQGKISTLSQANISTLSQAKIPVSISGSLKSHRMDGLHGVTQRGCFLHVHGTCTD